jgi:hypothetical protein
MKVDDNLEFVITKRNGTSLDRAQTGTVKRVNKTRLCITLRGRHYWCSIDDVKEAK